MIDMLEGAAGAGGVGVVMMVTYLRVIASRFDKMEAKLDEGNHNFMDHEVRIQVLEKLEEWKRKEEL